MEVFRAASQAALRSAEKICVCKPLYSVAATTKKTTAIVGDESKWPWLKHEKTSSSTGEMRCWMVIKDHAPCTIHGDPAIIVQPGNILGRKSRFACMGCEDCKRPILTLY